ncbi:MAG: imidazole glycerol phosphate synthase subunit HisF [Polyangia bacterium]|jgi:imidazoleglycerol phosphate synthase cyclase subunit|nr:imidazole glycerol phosphate synthase subunit HisF [Polyangia bacterium]
MLTVRIIPCLDVDAGRVVKGIRFQGLRDAGAPDEQAALYEAQGADEIVMLDVSATPEGRSTQVETVRKIRARLSIPLSVGGGVRSSEDAARLLGAGADKVGVNTAAVANPGLVDELAARFGSQCTVIAVDAQGRPGGGWEVLVRSGKEPTGLDAIEWMHEVVERGAGEILLTSWDRDGTGEGYNLELLEASAEAIRVPIIASGGAAGPAHMVEALKAGADAVLAASIFHYGEYTVAQVKDALASAGLEVRR